MVQREFEGKQEDKIPVEHSHANVHKAIFLSEFLFQYSREVLSRTQI